MDWSRAPGGDRYDNVARYFWETLTTLVQTRRRLPMLGGTAMRLLNTQSEHLLCFERVADQRRLIVIANFSEHAQPLEREVWRRALLPEALSDHLTGDLFSIGERVAPYSVLWLEEPSDAER